MTMPLRIIATLVLMPLWAPMFLLVVSSRIAINLAALVIK